MVEVPERSSNGCNGRNECDWKQKPPANWIEYLKNEASKSSFGKPSVHETAQTSRNTDEQNGGPPRYGWWSAL